MTADRDDLRAAGLGDEDTEERGAARRTGDFALAPTGDVTAQLRPRRPADDDEAAEPVRHADPMSVTQPSLPPQRSGANEAVTVPAFDGPRSGPTAAEIAARVRDRARTPAFPLPNSDHYEMIRFLGEGGMGKVFLARDRRLGREVAIKFVRGDNRDHTLRLLAEARAQAQVNHDRVCKVYEVDEVDGQVYIAMQYIDGAPLGALASELTVEQKVMVLRDAAEGVHAAHRVGIVHRDLNPNNIMVERDHDGRLRSYVMDFGLARDRKEGATETGTVMGTPHYMSPEQARGEVARLDRRADIYSLGASLYVMLTGVQPIPGDNGLVVLNNIQLVEPRRLRAIDPDIPADLEAIALKCLEKDRSARYDSARALAEDLGRFLDGEPVSAQRAGLTYRLRKRIHKHRRALTAAAVLVVLFVIALGWGLQARREEQHARREAAERERLARRFTERVEGIEASARYSALSRLHDIRADQQALRRRMDELAADVARGGPLASGPGHYALGRGWLALGDRKAARVELEQAWAAGYREPRVAYALALVLGALYQEALNDAERLRDADQREAKKQAIKRELRDPALGYLKQSQGPSDKYVSALIAFYEERHDAALALLDEIAGMPWFYEADELRGDIHLARAVAAANVGDRERALASFEAGRKAYAAAAATGESVPGLHAALASLERSAFELGMFDQADIDAPFARGIAAAERALAVQPDHTASQVLEAVLYRRMAEVRGGRGEAIDEPLQRAIAAGRRAVEGELVDDDVRAQAWLELSRIYWTWAEDRLRHDADPGDQLRLAVEASDRVPEDERDHAFYLSRGLIFKLWADHQDNTGADARPNRGKAIDAYQRALGLEPRSVPVLINLGANYLMRASANGDPDIDRDLADAAASLDRALAINPRHPVAHYYQCRVLQQAAAQARAHGGDPRPQLAQALTHCKTGIEIKADLPHLHNQAGIVLLDQAMDTWDRGGDPTPALDEARAAYERAIAAAPDQVYGYNNVGDVLRRRADFVRASGGDPTAAASAAAAAFERALTINPDDTLVLANLGYVRALLAAHAVERGRDPEAQLRPAEAAFTRVLAANPNESDGHLGMGSVLSVRAQGRARRGQGRDADFAQAAASFDKAVALAADDQDVRLDAGHFFRLWATWQAGAGLDRRATLARGRALADELLAARPDWASARVLRASLLVLEAAAVPPGEARPLATRAAEDFRAAFATNPHLEKPWRAQAEKAQGLAGS